MPRKKQNLLLQPRLPGLGFEPPPRHLHAVVTVTSHLIKADRGVQMPLPENASRNQCDQPDSLRWVRDRLATAGVTQQPEGER